MASIPDRGRLREAPAGRRFIIQRIAALLFHVVRVIKGAESFRVSWTLVGSWGSAAPQPKTRLDSLPRQFQVVRGTARALTVTLRGRQLPPQERRLHAYRVPLRANPHLDLQEPTMIAP